MEETIQRKGNSLKLAKEFGQVDVVIIDCYYVAYRAFCATPPLASQSGIPTSAIHGLLGAVRSMIKDLQPKSVIIATESRTSFREALHTDYKKDRSLPQPFSCQMPYIYEMAKLSGWHLLEQEGYEADDAIAGVVKLVNAKGLRAAIFTTDKDIISLVNERIGIFKREKGKSYILTQEDYTVKWGIPPAQIPELLALCGDAVDNIPGVKGIGAKSATKLIQQFGSVAGIYENLEKVESAKIRGLLDTNRENVRLSQELIQLRSDVPLDEAILSAGAEDKPGLISFFRSLDMNKTADSLEGKPKEQPELL